MKILPTSLAVSARRALSAVALAVRNAIEPDALGPLTKRVSGMTAGDWAWASREAEKYFGPFNPAWIPVSVLKRMLTDWSIGFAREIWLSAFHAVDYRVEGGDPRIRGFVEELVERHLWQWIEVCLRSLDYGHQACELVWSAEDVAFSYVEPPAKVKKPAKRAAREAAAAGENESEKVEETEETLSDAYVLGELRDLDPELIEVLADPASGDYRGLKYQGVELPGRKTLLVTNEPEFGRLLGRALNVRAYNPWWWGNLVYLGLNRYLERKGDPPLIGFAPGEETSDESGNVQDPIKVTAVGIANLRSSGAYVFPQEFDPESKQPLYSVRALEIANRAPEFLETIDRYEQAKRLAWFIPGSLGSGASFASDKVSQQLIHRMFDRRLQRLILDPLNKHVIPKLVRFNFGEVPAGDYPRLAAGSMAENAREMFAELVRGALQLEGVAPDGRSVQIAKMIDWAKGLRTLNVPRIDPALIPDAPPPPPPLPPPALPAPSGGEGGAGAPGRPPNIAPEPNRPNAPGRPGQTDLARSAESGASLRAIALAAGVPLENAPADPLSSPEIPEEDRRRALLWWAAGMGGLDAIDRTIWKTEKLVEAERLSLEAEIRNLAKKAIARAKITEDGAGREAIDARNRKLADEVEKQVGRVLEKSMDSELMKDAEITPRALEPGSAKAGGPRTPLAMQSTEAAKEASAVLEEMGLPAPPASRAAQIVRDVARDGHRNRGGVVIRETRRITESLDRLVIGEAPVEVADKVLDAYELPARDFVASTVHHVRATARATLAWSGAQEQAAGWLVAAGDRSAADMLDKAPTGDVAELLWTVHSTQGLDALYRGLMVDQSRPVTSWRNLGLNFGSPEMYLPIPASLMPALMALAIERRRRWNDERAARQADLERLRGVPPTPSPTPAA